MADAAPNSSSHAGLFLAELKQTLSPEKYKSVELAIADQLAMLPPTKVLLGLTSQEQLTTISLALENSGDPLLWNATAAAALKMMAMDIGKTVSTNISPQKLGAPQPKAVKHRASATAPTDVMMTLDRKRPAVKFARICSVEHCQTCNDAYETLAVTTCSTVHRGTPHCSEVGWFPHIGFALEGTLRSIHRKKSTWIPSPNVDPKRLIRTHMTSRIESQNYVQEIMDIPTIEPTTPEYNPLSPMAPAVDQEAETLKTWDEQVDQIEKEQTSTSSEELPAQSPTGRIPTLSERKAAERRLRTSSVKISHTFGSLRKNQHQ